jgi:hypothetical protein
MIAEQRDRLAAAALAPGGASHGLLLLTRRTCAHMVAPRVNIDLSAWCAALHAGQQQVVWAAMQSS